MIGGLTGNTIATCSSINSDSNVLIGGGSDDKDLMVNRGAAFLVYKSMNNNFKWSKTYYANDQNGGFRFFSDCVAS